MLKHKSIVSFALAVILVLPLVFAVYHTSASAGTTAPGVVVTEWNTGSAGSGGTGSGSSTPKPTAKPTSKPATPAPTDPPVATPKPTTEPVEYTYYSISASAGTGGTISPSGSVSVKEGSSKTFTITPNAGYQIDTVTYNGVSKGAVSSFNTGAVYSSGTIKATFKQTTFTITASAGTGGTISPTGAQTVASGSSLTFTITPSTGYQIDAVTYNGTSKGAVTSFNTGAVTANGTISATFKKINYTITASAGAGGTISPTGAQTVASGSSLTFTITPSTGYLIDTVTYNGAPKGAVTSFSTGAVTANGTVNATFKKVNTTDLIMTSITPLYARVGLSMLSLVTYRNTSDEAITTTLTFTAGGATQTKTITVPALAAGATTFTWTPSGLGSVTVSANINPAKTIEEIDYTNNAISDTVVVRPIVDPADPDVKTPTPITAPPSGENNNYVSWTGPDGTAYWARLTLTATADKSALKSGYGFGLTVTPTLTTNCPDNSVIIQPQTVVMRVPESHYETGVTLKPAGTSWTLPVNPVSVIGSSVWFVPVWFPDGTDYIGVVTAYGAFTPGGELTASMPVRIAINGSMYEDDSTNNAWGGR